MAKKASHPTKDLYRELRTLSWSALWEQEVPRFNQATSREREARVAVIRAVGAGFAEAAIPALQEPVRQWLLSLLQDPSEKIRRYATNALPKIGAGHQEEHHLLRLLQTSQLDREKKFIGQALNKIGGSATLDLLRQQSNLLPHLTSQRVQANLARQDQPSRILLHSTFPSLSSLRIHLRCRTGLETILSREIKETQAKFRILEILPGLIALAPQSNPSLQDLYSLRCFSTASFCLGTLPKGQLAHEPLAHLIASPATLRLLQTFTSGPLRYRLEFIARGHQRASVRQLAQMVFALSPKLLNDSRQAPWAIEIHPGPNGEIVELRPRLSPDPRFPYRLQDVPAASHPPLAAAMARLAGPHPHEIVWDPFCGSGLELIERARLGGVSRVLGTDLSPAAMQASQTNWRAARIPGARADFVQNDFRNFLQIPGCTPGSLTLLITNPPLGKRVPIPNLRSLLQELLSLASVALQPGGRMVWVNPVKIKSPDSNLRLEFQQTVDLGGFACRLELLRKH